MEDVQQRAGPEDTPLVEAVVGDGCGGRDRKGTRPSVGYDTDTPMPALGQSCGTAILGVERQPMTRLLFARCMSSWIAPGTQCYGRSIVTHRSAAR